jgi:hypothetical protein
MKRRGVGHWDFDFDDVVAVEYLYEESGGADMPGFDYVKVYLRWGFVLELSEAETRIFLKEVGGRWAEVRLRDPRWRPPDV